jgi:hypothetical protein
VALLAGAVASKLNELEILKFSKGGRLVVGCYVYCLCTKLLGRAWLL